MNTSGNMAMGTGGVRGLNDAADAQITSTTPFPSRLGQAQKFVFFAQQTTSNPFSNGTVPRLDGAVRLSPR